MTTYAKAITRAKQIAAANPLVDHLTTEGLKQEVEAISAELKGPGISAIDRLVMNEDRKAYRAEIARRESAA